MLSLLKFADAIERILKKIADAGAWAFIACIAVITLDVITRKMGFQFPGLGSTRLQELEWQLHTLLFCTWLGFAYMRNAHVRIDVFTSNMTPRRKLWLELLGCVIFALPYLIMALPYAHDFFMVSYLQGESSEAPNGLPYKWIVKFFLYVGFITVVMAVLGVICRCWVALFGPPELAARAHTPFATQH